MRHPEINLGIDRPRTPLPVAVELPKITTPDLTSNSCLDDFYQNEIKNFEISLCLSKEKVWQPILNRIKEVEKYKIPKSSPPIIDIDNSSPQTFKDKMYRGLFKLEAGILGVKNIDSFEDLLGFLKLNVTTRDSIKVDLKKEATVEEKQQIISEYRSQGWSYEEVNDKIAQAVYGQKDLLFFKKIPVNIDFERKLNLKKLITKDNHPTEITKNLSNLEIDFNEDTLFSSEHMTALGKLYSAPYVNDVLHSAQEITKWKKNGYFNFYPNLEIINLFTEISQNPNHQTEFSVEKNQKINLLARALLIDVGRKELEDLQTIVDNPDYLEFTSYVIDLCKNYSFEKVPILDHLKFLEENNLLQPLLELNRLGISVEKFERYSCYSDSPSIKSFFDNDFNKYNDIQKIRQDIKEYLINVLQDPEIGKLKNDPQNQNFVGLISHIRGYPVSLEELNQINTLFNNNLEKKQNAILILKAISHKKIVNFDYDIDFLSEVSSHQDLVKAFKNPEFTGFINKLKSTGYKMMKHDLILYKGSKLLEIFNNPIDRENLIKKSTIKIIKFFKGELNLNNYEYYINLGDNPKSIDILKCFKKYNINVAYGLESQKDAIDFLTLNNKVLEKLNSPELRSFADKLHQEFNWNLEIEEISEFIKFYENKDLQNRLFSSENYDFIKKVQPAGFSIHGLEKWLNLDDEKKQLMLDLISKINYFPESDPDKFYSNLEILDILSTDLDFKNKLFSEKTIEKFSILKKDFMNIVCRLEHITAITNSTDDLIPFLKDFSLKYKYKFNYTDINLVVSLAADKNNLYTLLDNLTEQGYLFNSNELKEISLLVPHASKLSETLINLKEIFSYKFKISDCDEIISIIQEDCPKSEFVDIKNIFEKYKDKPTDKFKIKLLKDCRLIRNNESFISKLSEYNYRFTLNNLNSLIPTLRFEDKNAIFSGLDILKRHYPISFDPQYSIAYSKLSKIKDIEFKINDLKNFFPTDRQLHSVNFKLFVALNADSQLYRQSLSLLGDEYFKNIRDANNRINKFAHKIINHEILDADIIKIFTLPQKATELDQISHKYLIAFEISKGQESSEWHQHFLQTANFNQASKFLTKSIVNLSIPIIYSDLDSELIERKKNQLINITSKKIDFDEILEINCRALGIYKQKYKNNSPSLSALTKAIQTSIELNLTSDSNTYFQKRRQLSEHQFNRIFEGVSENVKTEIFQNWIDLSPKNNFSTTGDILTEQEDTISRLNGIREIVKNDLSIHLGQLILTKINNHDINEDQIKMYQEHLIAPDGQLLQDIPIHYRILKKENKESQQIIRDVYLSPEERSNLGKKIGTYQSMTDCLKAVYKLGQISEENYKTKIGYVNQIDNLSGKFFSALKKLKLLDNERLSSDINIRALEEEVLHDFEKLKNTLDYKNISSQTFFQVESTVNFLDLSKAPEITNSCQRLTEVTGYNQAAFSRILDGSNEMIDVSEIKNGHKNRVARSFIELSKIRTIQGSEPRLVVLIDRLYVNPQFSSFDKYFIPEMLNHLMTRFKDSSSISYVFKHELFPIDTKTIDFLKINGYQVKNISGEYFINESNLKLTKYYDSLNGENDVRQAHWKKFNSFYLIEKTN